MPRQTALRELELRKAALRAEIRLQRRAVQAQVQAARTELKQKAGAVALGVAAIIAPLLGKAMSRKSASGPDRVKSSFWVWVNRGIAAAGLVTRILRSFRK